MNKRVGALSHTDKDKKEVYIFGYGEMVGCVVPDKPVSPFVTLLLESGTPNPKIVLDSGKTVWGCECWWMPEDEMIESVTHAEENNFKIIAVDIDEQREKNQTANKLDADYLQHSQPMRKEIK